MGLRFSTGVAVTLVAAATWIGCSGDPSPLGGPYGGTANMPNPTAENTNVSGGDDSGGGNMQGGSSGGNGTSSGGSGSSTSSSGSGHAGSSGSSTSSASSSGTTSGSSSSSNCLFGICNGSSSSSSSSGSAGSSSGMTSASSSGSSGAAPTWSTLYADYLAGGKIGNCGPCHSQCGSASNCYNWLKGSGYVGSSSPALASPIGSCLSWFGGNMPPGGPNGSSPQATQAVNDFKSWAAAGGLNN